jgi:hypothetical protein
MEVKVLSLIYGICSVIPVEAEVGGIQISHDGASQRS